MSVMHTLRHFPKVITAYTDRKDEQELASKYKELVIAEEEAGRMI